MTASPGAGALPLAPPHQASGPARPVAAVLIGAGCASCSAIFVQLAHAPAGTTGFFRCAFALPALGALAWREERRYGRRQAKERAGAALAGLFLAIDLVLWTHAIYDVGAGVATVLGNLQVLFVAVIAWAIYGERPPPRSLVALPLVVVGVVLVAGLLGHPRFGGHPLAGAVYGIATSVTYGVFIVLLRRSTGSGAHVATPLAEATAAAAVGSSVLGLALGQMSFDVPLRSLAWLAVLALVSQTLGWLFITSALPYLPAALSSLLLLFQ